MTTNINIDAKGKKIGRLASEIALILRGKDSTSFARNVAPEIKVTVENISLLDIAPEKKESKVYVSYTGYPGGLRKRSLDETIERKGYGEVLRKAVYGMLPKNKLRARMMKNLIIKE